MSRNVFKSIPPIFIFLLLAWGTTFILPYLNAWTLMPQFLDGHVYWQPGLAFSIAVAVASRQLQKSIAFIPLSTGIYFLVVEAYAGAIYGGPGAWYLATVLAVGALLELLLFAGVYGFFKRLRIGHFAGALLAAAIGFLCMDIGWFTAFLVWYMIMGTTFYSLFKEPNKGNEPISENSIEV